MKKKATTYVPAEIDQKVPEDCLKFIERERRLFSQDLHDEVGHNLIVLKLYIELMARDYKRGRTEGVIEKLEEAMALVRQSINSVRRLIQDRGPAMLDRLGLLSSFKVYAGQFSARTGINVEVRGKGIPELAKVYETALFRVLQGGLSNVAKHSKAKSVRVTVKTVKESTIRMTIEDNGIGFATSTVRKKPTFGLTSMQERIEKLGGEFCLQSHRKPSTRRSGTRIDVDLPIKGAAEGTKA